MKKKVIIGAVLSLGLCGLSVALVRPSWIGFGEEKTIRKRAQGYWDARVSGELKAIAPFAHPLQKALQDNSVLITESYEITGVKVDGDTASVGVKAKYRLKQAAFAKVTREIALDDQWVRYKGEWYHQVHPVGFSDILMQGLGKWKPPTEADSVSSNRSTGDSKSGS